MELCELRAVNAFTFFDRGVPIPAILRHLRRRVSTNECVETTVRDACDLGYLVTVVEDCCTTVTSVLHDASLKALRDRYCRVIKAGEAMADIEGHVLRDGKEVLV